MDTTRMTWENPRFEVQRFVPSEYCEYCFQYTITLHCTIDSSHTGTYEAGYTPSGNQDYSHYHQYAYCGTNYITVTITDGVPTYFGHESLAHEDQDEGTKVEYVRNVTPDILLLNPDDIINYAEWQNIYNGGEYNHHGDGVVNSKDMTWEGHPNHS